MALVVVEYEPIDGPVCRPLSGREDFDCADEGGHGFRGGRCSEEKVPLRHRQHRGRLARKQLAIRSDFVRFRVHLDVRGSRVEHHAVLADPTTGVLDRDLRSLEPEPLAARALQECTTHEQERGARGSLAEAPEHGSVVNRLWCGNACVRVPHRGGRDTSAFENEIRLYGKEGWRPDDQVGKLAYLD